MSVSGSASRFGISSVGSRTFNRQQAFFPNPRFFQPDDPTYVDSHPLQHVWLMTLGVALTTKNRYSSDDRSPMLDILHYVDNDITKKIVEHSDMKQVIEYISQKGSLNRLSDIINLYEFISDQVYKRPERFKTWVTIMNQIIPDYIIRVSDQVIPDEPASAEIEEVDDESDIILSDEDDFEFAEFEVDDVPDADEREYLNLPPVEEEDIDEPAVQSSSASLVQQKISLLLTANFRYAFCETPKHDHNSSETEYITRNMILRGKYNMRDDQYRDTIGFLHWLVPSFGLSSASTYFPPSKDARTSENILGGDTYFCVGEYHQPTGELKDPGIIVGYKKGWNRLQKFIIKFNPRKPLITEFEFDDVVIRKEDFDEILVPLDFKKHVRIEYNFYPRNPLMGTALFSVALSSTVLSVCTFQATQVDRAIVLIGDPMFGKGLPPGSIIRGKSDGRVFTLFAKGSYFSSFEDSLSTRRAFDLIAKTLMYMHMIPPLPILLPDSSIYTNAERAKHKILRQPRLGVSTVNESSTIAYYSSTGSIGTWFASADDRRSKGSILHVRRQQKRTAPVMVAFPETYVKGFYNVELRRTSVVLRGNNLRVQWIEGQRIFSTYDSEGNIVKRVLGEGEMPVITKDVYTTYLENRGLVIGKKKTYQHRPVPIYYDQSNRYDMGLGHRWSEFSTFPTIYVQLCRKAGTQKNGIVKSVFELPVLIHYTDSEFPELDQMFIAHIKHAVTDEPGRPWCLVANYTVKSGVSPRAYKDRVIGFLDIGNLEFSNLTKVPRDSPTIPLKDLFISVNQLVGKLPVLYEMRVGNTARLPNPGAEKVYNRLALTVNVGHLVSPKDYPGPNLSAIFAALLHREDFSRSWRNLVRSLPEEKYWRGLNRFFDNMLETFDVKMTLLEAWHTYGYANVPRDNPNIYLQKAEAFNPVQLQSFLSRLVPHTSFGTLLIRHLGEKTVQELLLCTMKRPPLYSDVGCELKLFLHFHIMGSTYNGPSGLTGQAKIYEKNNIPSSLKSSASWKMMDTIHQIRARVEEREETLFLLNTTEVRPEIALIIVDDGGRVIGLYDEDFQVVGTVKEGKNHVLPRYSGSEEYGWTNIRYEYLFDQPDESFELYTDDTITEEMRLYDRLSDSVLPLLDSKYEERVATIKAIREKLLDKSVTDFYMRSILESKVEKQVRDVLSVKDERVIFYCHQSDVIYLEGKTKLLVSPTKHLYEDRALMNLVSSICGKKCTSMSNAIFIPNRPPLNISDQENLLRYFTNIGFKFSLKTDHPLLPEKFMRHVKFQHSRTEQRRAYSSVYHSYRISQVGGLFDSDTFAHSLSTHLQKTYQFFIEKLTGFECRPGSQAVTKFHMNISDHLRAEDGLLGIDDPIVMNDTFIDTEVDNDDFVVPKHIVHYPTNVRLLADYIR